MECEYPGGLLIYHTGWFTALLYFGWFNELLVC